MAGCHTPLSSPSTTLSVRVLQWSLLAPCSESGPPPDMDVLIYYLSSLWVLTEQPFGVLVARWGIPWYPSRVSLAKNAVVSEACMRSHSFNIEQRQRRVGTPRTLASLYAGFFEADPDNTVRGSAVVFTQDFFHTKGELSRNRQSGNSDRRANVAADLFVMGYKRPCRSSAQQWVIGCLTYFTFSGVKIRIGNAATT